MAKNTNKPPSLPLPGQRLGPSGLGGRFIINSKNLNYEFKVKTLMISSVRFALLILNLKKQKKLDQKALKYGLKWKGTSCRDAFQGPVHRGGTLSTD